MIWRIVRSSEKNSSYAPVWLNAKKNNYINYRGTQRLLSVKYLFGEANIAKNFLLPEDDHFIHVQFSNSLRFSED